MKKVVTSISTPLLPFQMLIHRWIIEMTPSKLLTNASATLLDITWPDLVEQMFWHRGHELQSFSWLQMTGLPEKLCSSFIINLISSTSPPHNRAFECLYKRGSLKWPRASTQDCYSSIPAKFAGKQTLVRSTLYHIPLSLLFVLL